VVKERMRTLIAHLSKGYTLLEIVIVLTILSLASTGFYLLLREPNFDESIKDKVLFYQDLSIYTGHLYAFSHDSVNIYKNGNWTIVENFNSSYVESYLDTNNKRQIVDNDSFYLIISPGYEISSNELYLSNGEKIEFN
tara:strand:- start:2509 stop:2922 length:414 start_codon:yes stop_codon:yes gene_type:complete